MMERCYLRNLAEIRIRGNKDDDMSERPFRPHPKPETRADRPKPAVQARLPRISPEKAGEIAITGLSWLAAEPERLDRFLALTGIDHGSIRQSAAQPGFLGAVLDHIAGDEPTLMAFAADSNEAPETVAAARQSLAGPGLWDTP